MITEICIGNAKEETLANVLLMLWKPTFSETSDNYFAPTHKSHTNQSSL